MLYFRHGATDFGQNDDKMTGYEDCAQQRNLTDRGRADARAIGAAIKRLHIPVTTVLASPFCRTRETANSCSVTRRGCAGRGGPARTDDAQRYAALKALLSTPVPAGSNIAIVSHGNPFHALHGEERIDTAPQSTRRGTSIPSTNARTSAVFPTPASPASSTRCPCTILSASALVPGVPADRQPWRLPHRPWSRISRACARLIMGRPRRPNVRRLLGRRACARARTERRRARQRPGRRRAGGARRSAPGSAQRAASCTGSPRQRVHGGDAREHHEVGPAAGLEQRVVVRQAGRRARRRARRSGPPGRASGS